MSPQAVTASIIRGSQVVVTTIILAVSIKALAVLGIYYDKSRPTFYITVVAALDIIYFCYTLLLTPLVFKKFSPSIIPTASEFILYTLNLAALCILTINSPTVLCDEFYYSDTIDLCHIHQCLHGFSVTNWVLFTISFMMILYCTFIPEIKRHGVKHTLSPSQFYISCIIIDDNPKSIEVIASESASLDEANIHDESEIGMAPTVYATNNTSSLDANNAIVDSNLESSEDEKSSQKIPIEAVYEKTDISKPYASKKK